jgi:DNA repair protein RadC
MQKHLPISSWAEEDKPREKLLLKGKKSLSDSELLAILMGSGSRDETVVDLSKRILRDNKNDLLQLSHLTIQDLVKYKGVGEAKAIGIIAALELGNRIRSQKALTKTTLISSKNTFEYLQGIMGYSDYENFYIILLNRAKKIIRTEKVSEGSIAETVVDPKKIFRIALSYAASAIILSHNHPSGNISPSQQDIEITRKIVAAGRLLAIDVVDHIIIGNNSYYSFADNGKL